MFCFCFLVIDCGEPEPLLNGGVTFLSGSQNQYLSVVRYHCNEPFYSLEGDQNGKKLTLINIHKCTRLRIWRNLLFISKIDIKKYVLKSSSIVVSAHQLLYFNRTHSKMENNWFNPSAVLNWQFFYEDVFKPLEKIH